MSFINYGSREIHCKVIYYGAGLSGKTTCIQYVHDQTKPEARGPMVSLATDTDRTLFFDYFSLRLGHLRDFAVYLHLYSVPGQQFYNASRKLILKGADAIVFIADSQAERLEANIQSMEELEVNLWENGLFLREIPLVIQYNKRDLPNAVSAEELSASVNKHRAPEFSTTARDGAGIFDALKEVFGLVLVELKRIGAVSPSTPPAEMSGDKLWLPGRSEPFKGVDPRLVAGSLAEKLHAGMDQPEDDPFFRVWLRFPNTFPLGRDGCLFCVPPRELMPKVLLEQLNAARDLNLDIQVVFCADERQRTQLRAAASKDSGRLLAVVGPLELRDIVNSEDSQGAYARLVAAMVRPARVSPYRSASGVTNGRMFFGRRELISDILSRSTENFLVVGGRRLGKTALLQAIERERRPNAKQCIYLALPGDELVPRLADALGLSAGASLDDVGDSLRRAPSRLLLIDEVDLLVEREAAGDFPILRTLRAASTSGACNFVLAGHWSLFHSGVLDHSSPLLNFGEVVRLGALEPDESRDLAMKPMETLGVGYDSHATLDHLVTMTGGRANLVAAICRELLERIRDRRQIQRSDLDQVLTGRAVLGALEGWKHLSGQSGASAQAARANSLDRMVVYSTIAEGGFRTTELRRRLAANRINATTEELEEAIARLELDYVVRPDGDGFAYAVPLLVQQIAAGEPQELLRRELVQFRRIPSRRPTVET